MYSISTINEQPLTAQSFNGFDFANRYIAYIDAMPETVKVYSKAVGYFIGYLISNNITNPTRADILAYKEHLKEGHKANTVQLYIIAVRAFFSWLETEGIYPNIARNIKGAKVEHGFKRDDLEPCEVRDMAASIDTENPTGKRDYAIVLLLVACGLRTIEAMRADIQDFDGSRLFVRGKGREEKAQAVNVPDGVARAIRSYLATRPQARPEDPLFTSTSNNSKGERISTRSIRGLVKKYMQSAGIISNRKTAHSLRHTAITQALLGGASLQETQGFARHSNINTTMMYAHNIERKKNICADTAYNAIFGTM